MLSRSKQLLAAANLVLSIIIVVFAMGAYKWLHDDPLPALSDHIELLGAVSHSNAKVFVRDVHHAALECECRAADAAGPWSKGRHTLNLTHATEYSDVCIFDHLEASTRYVYRTRFHGSEVLGSLGSYGQFTTFPLPKASTNTTFLFGSCIAPLPWFSALAVFDWIGEHVAPDFALLLGDIVYADVLQSLGHAFRVPFLRAYLRVWSNPAFNRLFRQTPNFMQFDDHDVANDWVGWDSLVDEGVRKWFHLFASRKNPPAHSVAPIRAPPSQNAFHYSFHHSSSLDVFVVDTRGMLNSEPGVWLGDTQRHHLEEWLKTSRAAFKVVASPISWSLTAAGDENFGGFSADRDAVFDFITSNNICGVIILSGDTHWGAEYSLAGGAVREFSASPFQAILFPTGSPVNGEEPPRFLSGWRYHFGVARVLDAEMRVQIFGFYPWQTPWVMHEVVVQSSCPIV